MNYPVQSRFLAYSRLWGVISILCIISSAIVCLGMSTPVTAPVLIVFALTMIALASSVYYTPDYLHLTVNPSKSLRWQIKIRWRLIGAVLVIIFPLVSSVAGASVAFGAILWLVGANVIAGRVAHLPYVAEYFWLTDFALVVATFLIVRYDFPITTALVTAAGHLSVVTAKRRPFAWSAIVGTSGCAWILLQARWVGDLWLALAPAGVYLVSILTTAWLVNRAQRNNARNVDEALRELMDFTGYSPDQIRTLWSTSNEQLAKNWQVAGFSERDTDSIKRWYQENSGLYLFAISAYNLEYKRIKSNLKVLKAARGSCLDYGAGNGELILELARRDHPASYYDVEGETLKFAQRRAQSQHLKIDFLYSKKDLAAKARNCGFDTVFSFDVLEHVPDLPGELSYLCSLLKPGGLLVFDVPAGTTQSHPMHLNHNLDIHRFLKGKGLEEMRGFLQRLPFRKQEKYVFRAGASPTEIATKGASASVHLA